MGLEYTITEAKQAVKDGIEIYLSKDEEGKYYLQEMNRIPFYLEGKPGIGKTEIVKQIADEMEIGYVSFSLTEHNRNSILGMPVIKELEDGKYTEYTMSEIIAKVLKKKEDGMNEGILLLDEFSCVYESIMPAMLVFLQTKNIGTYTLPEGWVIVLCGNPPEYNRNAKKLDTVILDRVRKISVEFDSEVFINYAKCKKMHEGIISYLQNNPLDVYNYNREDKKEQLVTCRGWENLSHALYGAERIQKNVNEHFIRKFIKSDSIAHKFYMYYILFSNHLLYVDVQNILHGVNIQEYANRFMKHDDKFWWNIAALLTNTIEEKYIEVSNNINIMKLSKKIIDSLKDAKNILKLIKERKENEVFFSESTIPIWDCDLEDEYISYTDDEENMLCEWLEELERQGINILYNNNYKKQDELCLKILSEWYEKKSKLLNEALKQVSDMLSNIIAFLSIKQDNIVTDRVYQIINHSALFLKAVTSNQNKDYINLCKRNYACAD